jgi:uncharacterized membrane-anchored protein YhcB (DUF1043 family)
MLLCAPGLLETGFLEFSVKSLSIKFAGQSSKKQELNSSKTNCDNEGVEIKKNEMPRKKDHFFFQTDVQFVQKFSKVVKKLPKKLSKSFQKVVKRFPKTCKKLSKSYQKVVKKMSKSC